MLLQPPLVSLKIQSLRKTKEHVQRDRHRPYHTGPSDINPLCVAPTIGPSIQLPSQSLDKTGRRPKDAAEDRLRNADILAPGRLKQRQLGGKTAIKAK